MRYEWNQWRFNGILMGYTLRWFSQPTKPPWLTRGISQPNFWWRNWELWKLKTLNILHYFKMLILFSPIQNDEKQELVGPVPNQWETDGWVKFPISWVRIFNVLTEILQNFIHVSPISPRFFHIPRLSQAGAPDMLRMASRFPKCILNLWTYPYAQWGSHHPLGIVYMVSHDIRVYMEIYGNVWKYMALYRNIYMWFLRDPVDEWIKHNLDASRKILVSGKDYPIHYGKWKMVETTNQWKYMDM